MTEATGSHHSSLNTHLGIDPRWVGRVVELADGSARALLETLPEMAADDRGLVHGGFVFGLADLAAMAAVNHPNVVLGGSESRFRRPVSVGQMLEAKAEVEEIDGRRFRVAVNVRREGEEEVVLSAQLTCFVLDAHVLDG
ncbi:MAG: hotdog domain-containing protein [Acidobacteriota bacterium]